MNVRGHGTSQPSRRLDPIGVGEAAGHEIRLKYTYATYVHVRTHIHHVLN